MNKVMSWVDGSSVRTSSSYGQTWDCLSIPPCTDKDSLRRTYRDDAIDDYRIECLRVNTKLLD